MDNFFGNVLRRKRPKPEPEQEQSGLDIRCVVPGVYMGGHPDYPQPDHLLPTKWFVRNDGIEVRQGESRRFFIPAADILGVRSGFERARFARLGDNWFVFIGFQHQGQPAEVSFRIEHINREQKAEEFCRAVVAMREDIG